MSERTTNNYQRTTKLDKIIFKDLTTSPIGFGCTKLTDHYSRKDAIHTLETCLEVGITHFDTARMYGFGESEIILGDFLKDKRDKVTITTKIGLDPVALPTHSQFMVKLAKDVVNRLPMIKRMISKKTNVFVNRPPLSAERAKKHLEEALAKLKTDYIDILLLHEYDVATANQQDLISFFKEQIQKETVRHVGLGTFFELITEDYKSLDGVYDVLQTDNSILKPNMGYIDSKFLDTHLTIAFSTLRDLKTMQKFIEKNPDFAQMLKKEAEIDFSDSKTILRLAIDFTKYSHPEGINIFTSTNSQNIKNNVKEWENPSFSKEQVSIVNDMMVNEKLLIPLPINQ